MPLAFLVQMVSAAKARLHWWSMKVALDKMEDFAHKEQATGWICCVSRRLLTSELKHIKNCFLSLIPCPTYGDAWGFVVLACLFLKYKHKVFHVSIFGFIVLDCVCTFLYPFVCVFMHVCMQVCTWVCRCVCKQKPQKTAGVFLYPVSSTLLSWDRAFFQT